MEYDPALMGDPIRFIERLGRISERSVRAMALEPWGLSPQDADSGSSLERDNDGYLPELGNKVVQEAALWPLMSATDNLATAAGQFIAYIQSANNQPKHALHAPSMLTLCRAALEAAARSIWILEPVDRAQRRRRAFGANIVEMKANLQYTGNEVGFIRAGKIHAPAEESAALMKGHQGLVKLHDELKSREDEYEKPSGFMATVGSSAEWIETHIPAHDSGEIRANGVVLGAGRVYQLTSAITHGYKWAIDFLYNGELFALLADAYASAVYMTECGIALYEAQAQSVGSTARRQFYPELLQPTVQGWAKIYQPTT